MELPLEFSYIFAANTSTFLPGIQQSPDIKLIWNKYPTLSDLQNVYHAFMNLVKAYIDEISTAQQKNTEMN